MENDIFTAPLPTADQCHAVFDAVSSHMFSGPFTLSGVIDHNTHEHIMTSGSLSSTVQGELLHDPCMPHDCGVPNGGISVPRTILHFGSSFADVYSGNTGMGTSQSVTSLANLLSSDVGSGESLFNINNSSNPSTLPLNMTSLDSCQSFYSSYPMSRNHSYGILESPGCDEFLKVISMVHPSYHVMGNALPDWNLNNSIIKLDHSDNFLLPRNELSLSLGSCQPSVVCMPDIPDHCSEKSCSVVTQVTPKDSEVLSLYCGPSNSVHFSHVLLESKYLDVAQQVLAEVVYHALGNSETLDDSVSRIHGEVRTSFSSGCSGTKGFLDIGFDEFTSSGEIKSQGDIEKLVLEDKKPEKTKLVTMLQMVDHRYNQCLDHIQNVISTLHDATNSSSPQVLGRFALHTVSSAFKILRERITVQILSASQKCSRRCMRGKGKTFESSFIEKQWALQLGRNDQQSWRSQRGLPERSVSVLRAWMFQNFLHPYPKDSDKHLLAIQSGLTRSQVSNWFINARVRLWKPMIEEMYSEIRKRQTEGSIEGDFGSHGSISNQRPQTN